MGFGGAFATLQRTTQLTKNSNNSNSNGENKTKITRKKPSGGNKTRKPTKQSTVLAAHFPGSASATLKKQNPQKKKKCSAVKKPKTPAAQKLRLLGLSS